ncbi:efflux RND transporter periplasmic adaptor subunit [Roseomonas xinghualingensis]|uniref:efflux RND transporter periplasmic adaptor subunit n=1 Tax=Roseomonas xinghualingensis TaxID=2986475 RepID=UPI0021F224DA|nr:efflux RND transporter periplasmic adaptor subunit [Roseomonas sp. SXEYE001]MCV4208769.1 efflux RND transporter periplasmic adaptor subunit [Roseomonas sp. SXEYE001]
MPKPKLLSDRLRSWLTLPVLLLGAPILAACDDKVQAAQPAPPPPPVSVIRLQPAPVVIHTVLPGRSAAYQVAEIRPQVSGLLQERLFREGETVAAGQPLFQIDPAPYRAALASAAANQARAEASLQNARATTSRYRPLVGQNAVSRMEYDKAVAVQAQAEAEVAAAKAAVQSAQIDLERTRITSPIAGRTGRTSLTVGALVTANQAAELLTVTQLDPILVDVTQPAEAMLRLRRDLEEGRLRRSAEGGVEVRLAFGDGTDYPHAGQLQFAEATVDRDTGAVTMRAIFPNPGGMLMPGMFVRARVETGVAQNALLVPQQAVTRNPRGEATTLVVDEEGTVRQRIIETRQAIGNKWLVSSGLSAGDRVVVEGVQRVRDGVKPEVREVSLEELERGSQPDPKTAQARG